MVLAVLGIALINKCQAKSSNPSPEDNDNNCNKPQARSRKALSDKPAVLDPQRRIQNLEACGPKPDVFNAPDHGLRQSLPTISGSDFMTWHGFRV